jgi:hypothetical protein
MLALADPTPPATSPEPHYIPGLKYSPQWHREQEDEEQVWLNAYARWALKCGAFPVQD